jgi:hypothetical protein
VAHRKGKGVNHCGDNGDAREGIASRKCDPSSLCSDSKQYSVTDGRTALGTVELTSGAFVAVDSSGEIIGAFDTLIAAVPAFPVREGTP